MPNVHIVTDSCATFANKQFTRQYPVTVVPSTVRIGDKTYREGVDLPTADLLDLIRRHGSPPQIMPPSVDDFVQAYAAISKDYDTIISVHASREIYPMWGRARIAAQQITTHSQIDVIDTQTLCAAQGMLVKVGLQAVEDGADFEGIVRAVRGAVDRVYAMYYVDQINPLLKNSIMSRSHTVLGTMLGVKPFLAVEEGRLIPVEKVRSGAQALEHLIDFALEFIDLEDSAIVQSQTHPTEQTRALQERFTVEFPGQPFLHTTYGPSLAALIGARATGVVILEKETDGSLDDDYD